MRVIVDWVVYLSLWAIAIAIIGALYTIMLHNWQAGLVGFGAYFLAAHWLFKRLGYRNGIFDVP